MRWTFQVKMLVGFGSALVILIIIASLSYLSTRRAIEDSNWVAHTFKAMAEIEAIRSLVADAETAQRGYLITGDRSYLTTYEKAPRGIEYQIEKVADLTRDNPSQQRRIGRLRRFVKERFDHMDRTISLREKEGNMAALRAVAKGQALEQMARIREVVGGMSAEENWVLNRRVEASGRSFRHSQITYTMLILLDLTLLASVYHMIRHEIAERSRVEQQLRATRERYELAVRGSRDGFWDWDLATNEIYYSPRMKEILGLQVHEMSNRYEEWESRVHPDDLDRARKTIRDYLEGRSEHSELEHRLRHKDGTYRWVLSRAVMLRDEQGTPYRMAGSTRDITFRKQSEQHLLDQNRRLEEAARSERQAHEDLKLAQSRLVQSEKLVSLGQMVAGVAHELNNPLGFVINNVSVLERDVIELRDLVTLYQEADDLIARERPDLHTRVKALEDRVDIDYTLGNIHGLIKRSRDGLRRIHQILKDLRSFARLDEGEIKEADLNQGIKSAATIIRGNAGRKDIEITLDLDDLPSVTCNPAKINQVVMNLLSNAVDACHEGGKVIVRSRAEPGGVTIEVCDDGPGIDLQIRDRIFDPFFTTKPIGQGTGLGLSISYGIVQDHGGLIEVDSQPGRGTRMTVRLPIQSSKAAHAQAS